MMRGPVSVLLTLLVSSSIAMKYDPAFVDWNINTNVTATDPLDYWGEWTGHDYNPSPDNWRFPFYTLFLDKFVNGDPTNDNANDTVFEHDLRSNQMRHSGDAQGLIDALDYLHGMGIRGLYLAGSPLINMPWGADGYSILDHTLLDMHYATIDAWRSAIDEIHARGMYVLFDNTFATMGDLVGFEGYMNTSAPFTMIEHHAQWKSSRQYLEFSFKDNKYNETCQYPRFWLETGYPVGTDVTDQMKGCYDSDFDQYGDVEAFGVFPDWKRQLSKFASVQDRLREWHPPVRTKLQHFYCMIIASFDIDGFRFDKATQATVDAMGDLNDYLRECARRYGKQNFFLPGEITGGNTFGSIYIGRGRQPDMMPANASVAVSTTNASSESLFIRDHGHQALDAAAFHYTIYRSLTRFLGMDGNLAAGYDTPINWVDSWNTMLITNDFVNANTGRFDPRHMYGVSNQDLFRWPGIANGTERQLLGLFITTLHQPGIPLLYYGEEQAFYVFDNTASNYIYGRSPMTSSQAWQVHGCYNINPPSSQFYLMPVEAAARGCNDPWISLDHRDPSHPVRNVIKHMYQMRENFPALNDGWFLQQLSNMTEEVYYPGSDKTPTETGMWSVVRGMWDDVQNAGDGPRGNQSIWLLYSNENRTVNFEFDCNNDDFNLNTTALIAPFPEGTRVKNLFFPHEEWTLSPSRRALGLYGSSRPNGCLSNLTMSGWEFKAYVPIDAWVAPKPMMTKFLPGHDTRINASVAVGDSQEVDIEIHYSAEMDCDAIRNSISFNSTTLSGNTPSLGSSTCGNLTTPEFAADFTGVIASAWAFRATLRGVEHGIHRITINNATVYGTGDATNSVDHLLFRLGSDDNPMVFPFQANYTTGLLHKNSEGSLYVSHKAPGADMWRYSTNYGTTFSNWTTYSGGNDTIDELPWSGTKKQAWKGKHIIVEYWSRLAGSSDHQQHADLDYDGHPRRFPHMFLNGPYNQYGYDAGLPNTFKFNDSGFWTHNFMWEWPAEAQINVWGINPDGKPDQSFVYGDADNDNILDRLPPSSLSSVLVNITRSPPNPHLAWQIAIDDSSMKFYLFPVGSKYVQMILFFLLWIIPVLTGALGIWVFMKSFYQVKFNQIGVSEKKSFIPLAVRRAMKRRNLEDGESLNPLMKLANKSGFLQSNSMFGAKNQNHRRMVLIATMEYDIEDWAIKIKIGGLGVMAQLMGKNLGHQDLIWVVPCVGGVDYPVDQQAEPMSVTVLGNPYEVQVQYHVLRNITYVLLDAPVFRQQTKSEPYPPRMDDLDSAIYYSAWNQCIALAIKRFPIDLYHINDYHGSLAPLYLLPQTIPSCLSLHNAEFQGLWPMRTQKEREEVCAVFNLEPEIAQRYVQFGEVFNLLHAGASYLRVHQQGFGAVGVSKKYGKRSYARYPIFWGLKKVGNLPNPDPSDTGEWNKELPKDEDIRVDPNFEAGRTELKRQAQEWAGLEQNPKAELFVFVGRWSMQKGVDLIADVFPSVLESNPNVQLIAVGPVIDLYGKFAALKLDRMMKLYPGRVYSKPQFTALPPFIFSGAEFALIPSRDEPFGLVAVEFGRKGALGVGARVGGLGQMPGWWYTVESTTTTHLLHQFKLAIDGALGSKQETRAQMRARSAKQRFPVAQWVEDLEILQSTAIRIHQKEASKTSHGDRLSNASGFQTPTFGSGMGSQTPRGMNTPPAMDSRNSSYADLNRLSAVGPQSRNTIVYTRDPSPGAYDEKPKSGLSRQLSLGVRSGPGHLAPPERRGRRRLKKSTPSAVIESDNEGPGGNATDYDDDSDEDVIPSYYGDDEYTLTPEQAEASRRMEVMNQEGVPPLPPVNREFLSPRKSSFGPPADASSIHRVPPPYSPGPPSQPGTPGAEDGLLPPPQRPFVNRDNSMNRLSSASVLSLDSVVGDKRDFNLQKVDPFFTDSTGEFYTAFEKRLENLTGNNSESQLCIEDYLVKSEKKWFERFRNARLGRHQSPAPSVFHRKGSSRAASPNGSVFNEDLSGSGSGSDGNKEGSLGDEFLLGKDYVPPTGLKKWMQIRIGDWPIYSIFLGVGQIIAANSYQITLLTGEVGQTASKLYSIASVYLISSGLWWLMFRHFKSYVSLSLPFFFYGIAFMMIGLAHYAEHLTGGRAWVQNIGTGVYAVASSSGSVFFALNFGDEGGAPVKDWVFRACVIQGTQQAYVVALWFWGSELTRQEQEGVLSTNTVANTWRITAICLPVTALLFIIGTLMWFGLPNYYRQAPAKIPSFYRSLGRRKIVLWFGVYVIIQNFFLSAPYGRNWQFLWSSNHAPAWQIVLLVILFFIGVWALFLYVFSILSKDHSWILPVFAIGLGAPRWAQIWWGTSNIGQYVPWAGSYAAGALVSRSLWLWLGVLDSMQGVGFGMILLQTLTRVHICFTLLAAQVLGSVATMCARSFSPNNIGPGPIHPDISGGVSALWTPWFFIALAFQLSICAGFFTFFRKEQLSKP